MAEDEKCAHPAGASVINCCHAAQGSAISAESDVAEQTKTITISPDARKTIPAVKISRSVSRLLVNPACIAGVRTSRPNFSARCGLTKL